MPRNAALKLAIFTAGVTQREVADRADISESKLSLAISGLELDPDEKARIAKALNTTVDQIFPEVTA